MSVTYPVSDTSDKTLHPEVAVTQPGVIQYIVYVPKGDHCLSDVMIVDREEVQEDMKTVNFSNLLVDVVFNLLKIIPGTFDVQECDVSSDQHTSSILVECTFAINSTAPGIVVIQDDQNPQVNTSKTLQRLLQDSDKGSVNITGLPAGEYSVRVYDNSPATDSTSAAYQHSQLINIMELPIVLILQVLFHLSYSSHQVSTAT